MKKRVVSMILVLCFVGALFVAPVSAVYSGQDGWYTNLDSDSVTLWNALFDGSPYQTFLDNLGFEAVKSAVPEAVRDSVPEPTSAREAGWNYINWAYQYYQVPRGETDLMTLRVKAAKLENAFNMRASDLPYRGAGALAAQAVWRILGLGSSPKFKVTTVGDSGYRIAVYSSDNQKVAYLVTSSGQYAWAPAPKSYNFNWRDASEVSKEVYENRAKIVLVKTQTEWDSIFASARDDYPTAVSDTIYDASNNAYRVIKNYMTVISGSGNIISFACSWETGAVYAFPLNANTAEGNDRPTSSVKDSDGNTTTVNNTSSTGDTINVGSFSLLDLRNSILYDINGDAVFVDNLYYDQTNYTYNIDARKTIYDVTNNYYITQNYYYSWTYHINYTSITYIGQSEEYDKTYNVYYQLPDGRSSADLTAEELEQLNLSVDVINYGRSADDVRLRSLYHFDGTTDDASYWNYCTDFTWNTGASLTYMESGNFNGALYLDELEHDFTLTLPSAIGSQDFTLQFRLYQSYTASPSDDSYIMLGSTKYFRMDGAQFRTGADSIYTLTGSNVFADTPIGTWNEIAIIRDDGTMRFYLNGVQVGSHGNLATIDKTITFHFGSAQQTYKELDELRVLNYALVTDGANYQPTSVPHDTNLALVLPDSVIPVADEYWNVVDDVSVWKFNPQLDDDLGMLVDVSAKTVPLSASGWVTSNVAGTIWASGEIDYYSPYTGVYPSGSTVILSNAINDQTTYPAVIPGTQNSYGYLRYYSLYKPALTLPVGSGICYGDRSDVYNIPVGGMNGLTPNEAYKCYLAFDDGTSLSLDFTIPSSVRSNVGAATVSTVSSDSGSLSLYRMRVDWLEYYYRVGYALSYVPPLGADVGLLYWAIVPTGSSIEVEKVSSVTLMDSASLNTPTLAVRSDIPVTDYQIGGVRPSIPYKGLVYAMVESGYITSLQIYDGRAWVQVDGRIWTGERWIPYSSYNVVTLSDMYDIADASGQSGYEYIYTDTGFWSWLQKFLLKFREDLFALLQSGNTSSPGHQHVYTTEILREATCTESGLIQYTCTAGDHTYTAAIEPLEHDWVASEVVEDRYSLPEDTVCPNGVDHILTHVLDKSSGVYHVTCSDCGEEFDVDAEIEYGYTIYTCTRCGETYKESNKDSSGLFEALGNFFADGILWIVDKLTQLVEALNSISDIFNEFAQSLEESAGGYPGFFGEVLAVMPEDLMNVIWFAIIGVFAVAAWKKFFG